MDVSGEGGNRSKPSDCTYQKVTERSLTYTVIAF